MLAEEGEEEVSDEEVDSGSLAARYDVDEQLLLLIHHQSVRTTLFRLNNK